MTDPNESVGDLTPPRLAQMRAAIGALQGLVLYLLYSAADAHVWPATSGFVFAPLLLVAVFVPLIFLQGIGTIRLRALLTWMALGAAVIAALAWYDIWRAVPALPGIRLLPGFGLCFFLAAGIFIAHALVTGGDLDRRFMAKYPTYFDVAWKHGLQIALALLFTGAFWGMLWLGASLFNLIGLSFLEKLIEHRWFAIPATSLAVAAALHVTDIRAGLVRGLRTLVLALLSWLLPLMGLFAAGFLVSLLGTGLHRLWAQNHASGELLAAAAALVVLINAMYQDGVAERRAGKVLRYAGLVAALSLVPIVALAAYALALRVAQYGWTEPRIATAASLIVALAYALGYSFAVFRPGLPLAFIERCNFAVALLVLAVLLAIFSPLADPARLSVNSQMARLASGRVSAAAFDYDYLRWGGARFGGEALKRLSQSANPAIGVRARAALASKTRIYRRANPGTWQAPAEIVRSITVYPKGKSLPPSFVAQNWQLGYRSVALPACLGAKASFTPVCDAILADLDGDGVDEVILLASGPSVDPGKYWAGNVFRLEHGRWEMSAQFPMPHCDGDRKALLAGKFQTVPPQLPAFKDVLLNGRRVLLQPHIRYDAAADCALAH